MAEPGFEPRSFRCTVAIRPQRRTPDTFTSHSALGITVVASVASVPLLSVYYTIDSTLVQEKLEGHLIERIPLPMPNSPP